LTDVIARYIHLSYTNGSTKSVGGGEGGITGPDLLKYLKNLIGLDTENVEVLADGSTKSTGGGEGDSTGLHLLKYLKEELSCDCIASPTNAGRILFTL
jgi:hypothetical protein